MEYRWRRSDCKDIYFFHLILTLRAAGPASHDTVDRCGPAAYDCGRGDLPLQHGPGQRRGRLRSRRCSRGRFGGHRVHPQEEARLAPRQAARRQGLRRDPQPRRSVSAPHRLRVGQVPQPRRVLGPRHRHHDDPRRRVHPLLRLLQHRHRSAPRVRPRRATPRRRGGGAHAAQAHRHHQRQPRRTARRRRGNLGRDHPRDPPAQPRHVDRGAHPRFLRRLGRAATGLGRAAGDPQPQHGDGAADVQGCPAAGDLRAVHRAAPPGEGAGPDGQDRDHGGHRRTSSRGRRADAGRDRRHPRGRRQPRRPGDEP